MTSNEWQERFGQSLHEDFEYGYCLPPFSDLDPTYDGELYVLTKEGINRMLRDTLLSVEALAREFLMIRKENDDHLSEAVYAALATMANQENPLVDITHGRE